MNAIALVAFIASMFVAGRMAERRGRSITAWLWVAAFIGPLALPLLFMLPNLRGKDPKGPSGENRPADVIGAVKPVIPGNPDPGRLNTSFASA